MKPWLSPQSKQALRAPGRPPAAFSRAGLGRLCVPGLATCRECLRRAGAGTPAQPLPDTWLQAGLSPKLPSPCPSPQSSHVQACVPECVPHVGAVIALKTLQILYLDLSYCFVNE